MDETLYTDLPLARRSILPGAGFFRPDQGPSVPDGLPTASAVVIADGDADGLGCAALIRAAYDDPLPDTLDAEGFEPPDGDVVLVPAAPYSLAPALATVAAHAPPTADVFVCDLCPDDPVDLAALPALVGATTAPDTPFVPADDAAATLPAPTTLDAVATVAGDADADADADADGADAAAATTDGHLDPAAMTAPTVDRRVRWFDHHQWAPALAAAVRAAGVDLVVGASDEECSTDVTLRQLEGDLAAGDGDRAAFAELAAVTRDHDLWLREDPRSDDLADYAHWSPAELYVATVRSHGPDLPPAATDFLADRRREKAALVRKAVERAELRSVEGVTVGLTYGRCSQNEVADELRAEGADVVVVVKPSGSASLRGSDAFARCHQAAARVGGGGHPKAAGCKPDVYDDILDYAHHWTTRGATARRVIRRAIRETIAAHDAHDATAVADATVEGDGTLATDGDGNPEPTA